MVVVVVIILSAEEERRQIGAYLPTRIIMAARITIRSYPNRRAIIARVVILAPTISTAIKALIVVVAAIPILAPPRITVARIAVAEIPVAGIAIATRTTNRTIAAPTSIECIIAIAAKPACALLVVPPIGRRPVTTLPVWRGSITV